MKSSEIADGVVKSRRREGVGDVTPTESVSRCGDCGCCGVDGIQSGKLAHSPERQKEGRLWFGLSHRCGGTLDFRDALN